MTFENKVVLVTGSNRGIGKALVDELLSRDVKKIYTAARNLASLSDFQDERVHPLTLDITKLDQVQAAAKQASDTDILINNAGAIKMASALYDSIDVVRAKMEVNYYGLLSMMRAFVPILESKKDSAIVNIISIAAFVNFPAIGGYCASKAAAFSISQGARIELAPKGIQVHIVNPGPIDTEMSKDFDMEKTSPEDTAIGILDGLEAGKLDIVPDATGQQMFETWQNNYKDLETMAADYTNEA